jgi:hypothetical protein
MSHSFKLARRIARFRAPVLGAAILTFLGCNSTDSFTPDTSTPAGPVTTGSEIASTPSMASGNWAGGIPIGLFAQPTTEFGARYNGAKKNIGPQGLVKELAAIKARGGRTVLAFAGDQKYWRDAQGHFSFDKWKSQINRYKGVNFSSYIADGTVIGHYLVDEPNDPNNWSGQPISPQMVEAMAQYSKQLWPGMPTLVRADPEYFVGRKYQYLDAAWAQYLARKGNVNDYIRSRVADAQKAGLQLVVGLNFTKGGNPTGSPMSASEIESWGSALLSSSYPCAFISYQYHSGILSNAGVKDAMDALRKKAQNRATKSCKA